MSLGVGARSSGGRTRQGAAADRGPPFDVPGGSGGRPRAGPSEPPSSRSSAGWRRRWKTCAGRCRCCGRTGDAPVGDAGPLSNRGPDLRRPARVRSLPRADFTRRQPAVRAPRPWRWPVSWSSTNLAYVAGPSAGDVPARAASPQSRGGGLPTARARAARHGTGRPRRAAAVGTARTRSEGPRRTPPLVVFEQQQSAGEPAGGAAAAVRRRVAGRRSRCRCAGRRRMPAARRTQARAGSGCCRWPAGPASRRW